MTQTQTQTWTVVVRTPDETQQTKHTGSLYIANAEGRCIVDTESLDVYPMTADDRARVVRALNAHDDLVAALKGVMQYCVTGTGLPDKGKGRTDEQQAALDLARAALAAAKD